MKNLKNTKDFILHIRHYISGETLDFGAGGAKYQHLIRPLASKYIPFDMQAGKNIDVVGSVLNPPFPNSSFDTVISTQVLEHVEKPWIMVGEINRILKSGGICILSAPFMAPYHADPQDYFRFTREGMKSLFQDDFEIVECRPYGKTFMVLFESIKQVYFSPYKKSKRNVWFERFLRYLEKTCFFLDRFIKNEQIYANVYIVARKK